MCLSYVLVPGTGTNRCQIKCYSLLVPLPGTVVPGPWWYQVPGVGYQVAGTIPLGIDAYWS